MMSHIEGGLLRIRIIVYSAGGILFQTLLILICVMIRRLEPGVFYLSRGFDLSNSFIISNIFLISISLLPMRTWFRGIRIPNDGLNIIRTLLMNNAGIREVEASGIMNEGYEYLEKKEYEKAADVYTKCIEQYPAFTIPRINLSAVLIRSLKLEEAKKILDVLIAEKHDEQYDFLIYNNLAWLLLLQNDRASLVEAEKYSRMAYDLNPDVSYVRNTRGCVLIEAGQIDEGVKLLKKNVYLNKPIDEEKNNLAGIFSMGYAYYMKGEKDKARNYLTHLEGYDKLDKDDKYIFDLIKTRTGNFGEV
jgi:tetratricopeptide (TPR) repeat protein